eukprot:2762596-Alexandrium_andersonii.AAC.1
MSASLVGSEMCIRDSTPTRFQKQEAPSSLGTATGASRTRRHAKQRSRCCLLYTSDAADDM